MHTITSLVYNNLLLVSSAEFCKTLGKLNIFDSNRQLYTSQKAKQQQRVTLAAVLSLYLFLVDDKL